MRPRDLLLLFAATSLAAGVGLVVMGSDTLAVELPPPVEAPAVVTAPATPTAQDQVERHDGDLPPVALSASPEAHSQPIGWTKGVVRGDVQIAVSILDKIQSLSVVVEELRNHFAADGSFRHPFRIQRRIEMGIGTPTFEVTDIPFSEYPYLVTLYSPGLNGGSRTVTIDAEHPLHEDLVLSLTPGAPFTVLLRDQDLSPYPQVEVRMIPQGEPHGRPTAIGTTDSYGSVVFDGMLAGDYQIHSSKSGLPLAEPVPTTVQPGARQFGTKVQGQSHVVTIPRGQPLEVLVECRGYGVENAKVRLQASDKIRLTQMELATDFAGRAVFPHLTPGVWLVHVIKEDYDVRTRQITIKDHDPPAPLRIDVVRLR